MAVITEIEEN